MLARIFKYFQAYRIQNAEKYLCEEDFFRFHILQEVVRRNEKVITP